MMLYIVHGNTWYEGYGYRENIFGIYTSKGAAEIVKDRMIVDLYEKK